MDKALLGLIIIVCLIGSGVWYFLVGATLLETWNIENIARQNIVVDENYKLDDVFVIEYSENWWYISVHTVHIINGTIGWDLLKYNSVEHRFVYDNLNHINIIIN